MDKHTRAVVDGAATDFTPGTQVAIGRGAETRLGVVERTTEKQILVRFYSNREPARYWKDGLRAVGAGTWDRDGYLRLATEQDRSEIEWRRIQRLAKDLQITPLDRAHPTASKIREELDSFLARTAPKETDR